MKGTDGLCQPFIFCVFLLLMESGKKMNEMFSSSSSNTEADVTLGLSPR